jgi:hypothetical protein
MDYIDLLGDPAYRHMLLNHVPIIGLLVAFLVVSTGLVLRQTALQFTGLVLIALTAGSSILVANYGDAAYPAIYDTLDGAGQKWLDYHAELAQTWLPVLVATAVLAVVAIVLGVWRRSLLPWTALLVALVTLAGIGGAGVVARAGGQIQHPEFRIGDPPVVQAGDKRRG